MRYAVYFTPPADHPLTSAASDWLGRDAFRGENSSAASTDAEHAALINEPARYGFHATLKAPFSLAEGHTEATLCLFFSEFCARAAPTSLPRLELSEIGPFFALTCAGGSEGINALCNTVVEAFEPWRAPLTPQDYARRKPERLSERQRELLARWGYPYVFEEFRFHMTLTGPVEPSRKAMVRHRLEERFAPFLGNPLPVEHLALFVEKERGSAFSVLNHLPLTGQGEKR